MQVGSAVAGLFQVAPPSVERQIPAWLTVCESIVMVASRNPEIVESLQKFAEQIRADLGDALTGVKGTGRREAEKANAP